MADVEGDVCYVKFSRDFANDFQEYYRSIQIYSLLFAMIVSKKLKYVGFCTYLSLKTDSRRFDEKYSYLCAKKMFS